MQVEDFNPDEPVAYVDKRTQERKFGRVSSVNDIYVFVKFDETVAKLGWQGTTAQACHPSQLEKAPQ